MIINRVCHGRETLFGVACFTSSLVGSRSELPGMSVCMAIRAGLETGNVEAEFPAGIPCAVGSGVAALTCQACVRAPKGETGSSVIELHLPNSRPRFRGMAAGASLLK